MKDRCSRLVRQIGPDRQAFLVPVRDIEVHLRRRRLAGNAKDVQPRGYFPATQGLDSPPSATRERISPAWLLEPAGPALFGLHQIARPKTEGSEGGGGVPGRDPSVRPMIKAKKRDGFVVLRGF